MKKDDALHLILSEWLALPEADRKTDEQATRFALKITENYPFKSSGDRYQVIHGFLTRRLA